MHKHNLDTQPGALAWPLYPVEIYVCLDWPSEHSLTDLEVAKRNVSRLRTHIYSHVHIFKNTQSRACPFPHFFCLSKTKPLW